MSFEDCVYVAKSKCGSKFRIIFTPDNDIDASDPEFAGYYGRMYRRECYDENYVRYIYSYYPNGNIFKGIIACSEVDGSYDWYDVILEEDKPDLVADEYGRLTVLDQISGEYHDWVTTIADEDILLSMDIFRHSQFGFPVVKVLGISRLKSTGNYRVKIRVAYRGRPVITTWNLLMDYSGFILKKAICDDDNDENRLHF